MGARVVAGGRRGPHRERWGVRARITVIASAAVVLPLLLVIVAVAVLLHQMLLGGVVDRLSRDAAQVGSQVTAAGPRGVDVEALGPDSRGVAVRVDDTAGHAVFAWPSPRRARSDAATWGTPPGWTRRCRSRPPPWTAPRATTARRPRCRPGTSDGTAAPGPRAFLTRSGKRVWIVW